MKLCSHSAHFKNIIDIVLADDWNNFRKKIPKNLNGQIDKMLFINFCLVSKSYKIIRNILKNQQLRSMINTNKLTLLLLLNDKNLNYSEKTYIYSKIIKNRLKISDNKLFRYIVDTDISTINWLKNSKTIKNSQFYLLFNKGINRNNLDFCRYKFLNINELLIKSGKEQIIYFENYSDFFNEEELLSFVNFSLKIIIKQKEKDINLLDSIIQILINNQYLIPKISEDLLYCSLKEENILNLFEFLNMDIQKILLYKKFSQTKLKDKVKKI